MINRTDQLRHLLNSGNLLAVPGCHDAISSNLIENGKTPILSYEILEGMGNGIAVYPLSLLSASIRAMQETLGYIKTGEQPRGGLHFEALQAAVGFPADYAGEEKYRFE